MVAKINQVPPSCAALDRAEVERTLVANAGNVSATAHSLGVPSSDLRLMVQSSSLANVAYEQIERDLDKAWGVVLDAIRNGDGTQRLQAASLMLKKTDAGRARGFGAVGYQPTGRPMGGPKKADVLDWRYGRRSTDDGSGSSKN